MALRLRRGTDAERQLITPAEGELVYTTDTKSVYIGDGATVGGIIISGEIGLGDLVEVDLSTPPTVGQVLKWDGAQFVPSDDAENDGIIEGSNYRINIVGDDSSLIVDTSTNTVTGTFVGDVQGSVFSDDSAVLVDSVNGVLTGRFVGEVVTNESITSNLNQSILSSNDGITFNMLRGTIESPSEPDNFDRTNIIWNSYDPLSTVYQTDAVLIGYHQLGGGGYIALSASDNSYTLFNTAIELDGKLGTILLAGTTSVAGSLSVSSGITGDLTGSLFSDSSTMLIDGTDGKLLAANINVIGNIAGTPSVGAGDLANVNEWLQVTVNGNTRYIPLYA